MAETENRDTTSSSEEENDEAWGTLEELLLACAVNRHGANCWDSIAKELHNRSFRNRNRNNNRRSSSCLNAFTPHNCEQRFRDMKCRFNAGGGGGGVHREVRGGDGGPDEVSCMVDELRKRRIDELRRAVQRHDASIVSLQLKVKRLEEEEEQREISGLKPAAAAETYSKREPDKKEIGEPIPVRTTYGNEPDKGRSSNGGSGRLGLASKRVEEGVGDGSRDSASESVRDVKEAVKHRGGLTSSDCLWRSWRDGGGARSSSGEEAEELSPANRRRFSVECQPLILFMETLRSHKHGSVFQRRLPSQETKKYTNMVRQHMDLRTVQSRLDRGMYRDSHVKFYRDLLLLFTNAVHFYPKSYAEHMAACELRELVKREIPQKTTGTTKPIIEPEQTPELQLLEPVVRKRRSATTAFVCRLLQEDKKIFLDDGDGWHGRKSLSQKCNEGVSHHLNEYHGDHDGSNGKGNVQPMQKKSGRRERSVLGGNGTGASAAADKKKKIKGATKLDHIGGDDPDEEHLEFERKKGKKGKLATVAPTPTTRKRGAANFLKRIEEEATAFVRRTSGRRQSKKDQEKKVRGRGSRKPPPRRKEAEPAAGKRKRDGGEMGIVLVQKKRMKRGKAKE